MCKMQYLCKTKTFKYGLRVAAKVPLDKYFCFCVVVHCQNTIFRFQILLFYHSNEPIVYEDHRHETPHATGPPQL